MLARHLGHDGYIVEIAASGEDRPRRVASGSPPVLIFLDIRLAGEVDGWGVLTRLKERADTAGIPVLVCTAYGGRKNAAILGASGFLQKPFSAQQLRETVARLPPAGGRSVLVVDDEEPVRRLVVEPLGGYGLELRKAAEGEDPRRGRKAPARRDRARPCHAQRGRLRRSRAPARRSGDADDSGPHR